MSEAVQNMWYAIKYKPHIIVCTQTNIDLTCTSSKATACQHRQSVALNSDSSQSVQASTLFIQVLTKSCHSLEATSLLLCTLQASARQKALSNCSRTNLRQAKLWCRTCWMKREPCWSKANSCMWPVMSLNSNLKVCMCEHKRRLT